MVDAPPPATATDERTWSVILHVSALSGLVIPLGNVIGPLVVWLLKRPESELIDRQGKAALNFQISSTIYFAITVLLMLIVIGFLFFFLYGIFWFVMVIVATVRAADGRAPGYLLGIPFMR